MRKFSIGIALFLYAFCVSNLYAQSVTKGTPNQSEFTAKQQDLLPESKFPADFKWGTVGEPRFPQQTNPVDVNQLQGKQLQQLFPGANMQGGSAFDDFLQFPVSPISPVSNLKEGQIMGSRSLSPDGRDLKLNGEGKFLSVEDFEVEFRIPPNEPGVCATPMPYVMDKDGVNRVNCPQTVPCDDPATRDANIPTAGQALKYVSLRWIVILDGGPATNIDSTRIVDLMNENNADFAAGRIEFCIDTMIFVEDATHYNLNVGTEDGSLKNTHGANSVDVCNVYVVNNITNPSAGGYARFPYDPFGGTNIRGGVVLGRSNCFVGTHTLAHELGHTFGLYHTFRGVDEVGTCTNCYERVRNANGSSNVTGVFTPAGGPYPDQGDREGDLCSDTNPHETNSFNCFDPTGSNACDSNPWNNTPVDNHMSYSFCTSTFTTQQFGRMHCMMDTYLSSWQAYGGSTCGTQPPVANFVGSPTIGISPLVVNFTDLSQPQSTITSWEWDFDVTGIGGATPATFSGQNPPVVTYTTADTCYTVRLIVNNPNGADTLTRSQYICLVSPSTGGQCDTLNNFDTPTNTGATFYTFGANDHVTGRPNSQNWISFYERFFTTGPNFSICRIDVALAGAINNSGNLGMRVIIYPDSSGVPRLSSPLGGTAIFGPDTVGVPAANNSFVWLPITFCDAIELGANTSFHVGVEMVSGTFTGATPDRLILITDANGFGQSAGVNNVFTFLPLPTGTFFNYFTDVGLDFDLGIIPVLGELPPTPAITGFGAVQGCDSTLAIYVDTFFCSTPEFWEFDFRIGPQFTDTSYAAVDTFALLYLRDGPDTLTIRTTNACGRVDSALYTITYPFDTTPNVDFSRAPIGDVCAGTPVTYTATPAGLAQYDWDFGDGTTTTTAGNSTSHTYTTPGLYYVSTTGTSAIGCADTETKLDYIRILDCSTNPPIAGFSAFPDSGCVPVTINIMDTSAGAPDTATSWFYDFGDGTFTTQRSPSHVYNTAGTFTVMQIVTNAGGSDTAYFTIKSIALPCTLPIRTDLSATPVNEQVILRWRTPDPASKGTFYVQRSADGQQFNEIGTVFGEEAVMPGLYGYVDADPGSFDKVYYRVRSVDVDGEEYLSNVVEVSLSGLNADWVKAFPNPVSRSQELIIETFLPENAEVEVSVIDMMGRILSRKRFEAGSGVSRETLNVQDLRPGSYLLKVSQSGWVRMQRIVVE